MLSGILKLMKILLLLAVLLILVLTIAGPFLFSFVFGENWKTAGVFSQILVFGYAMHLMAGPVGNMLHALNQMRLTIYFPVIYFVLMSSAYFFRYLPIDRFLMLISAIDFVAYLIYILIVYYAITKYEKSIG